MSNHQLIQNSQPNCFSDYISAIKTSHRLKGKNAKIKIKANTLFMHLLLTDVFLTEHNYLQRILNTIALTLAFGKKFL